MASSSRIDPSTAAEIDRLATAVAKDPRSKEFLPLADEYIKVGMWQEAAVVLEDGLKAYPGFVTAMAALGRVYDQLGQAVKAKAILEDVVRQRPDNLRAHRILAKLYHAEGNADLALLSCTAILNANPFDKEAASVKRSITGAPDNPPAAKREKKRIVTEPRPDSAKAGAHITPAPEPTVSTSSMASEPVTETLNQPTPDLPVVKHATAIARLEAWLRTIQAQRVH